MNTATLASPALPADWRDFLALTKPRVMTLVVFTGLAGLLVAPVQLHPVLAFTAILCIAMAAGAAAALNMWYEADIDALMKRTAKRPIPAGRMDRESALQFGVGLGAFSVLLMGVSTNWVAAGVLAASILFYVLVYTVWLKRRTPQNIVIGGAAGAFPPVIGWAAATGDVTLLPLLLFTFIFLWTPPPACRCCRSSPATASPASRSRSTPCRWPPPRSRPGRSASPARSTASSPPRSASPSWSCPCRSWPTVPASRPA
jgi:heme o synthase